MLLTVHYAGREIPYSILLPTSFPRSLLQLVCLLYQQDNLGGTEANPVTYVTISQDGNLICDSQNWLDYNDGPSEIPGTSHAAGYPD